MSGIRMGHSHHRHHSAEKTLRRCRNKEKADDVILIDTDCESFDNVVIIDLPDALPKGKLGSDRIRKDKCKLRTVIYIDDDETPNCNHSVDANNNSCSGNCASDREPCHATVNSADSADATVEGCHYVPDNTTPVRLSKCKRTYSGKTSRGNRYGLNTDSETDSSSSDFSDCELVDDSSGKVHWEKAFSRRRKGTNNGRSGIKDHGSTSQNPCKYQCQKSGMEDATRQPEEASFCFSKEKSNNKTDTPYDIRDDATGFGYSGAFDDPIDPDVWQSAPNSNLHNDVRGGFNSEDEGSSSVYAEKVDLPDCVPVSFDNHVVEKEECLASSNLADENDHQPPAWSPRFGSHADKGSWFGKSSPTDDHKSFNERNLDNVNENVHCATGSANERGNFMPETCSFNRFSVPDSETYPRPSRSSKAVRSVSGKPFMSKSFSGIGKETVHGHHQEYKQPVSGIPLSVNNKINLTNLQEDDPLSNSDQETEGGSGHIQDVGILPSEGMCIISEREKIKETDEYKKAIEEEWASRQHELAVQAEEAKKMRRLIKRRKAESERLLDMEKRQKQRLEEIRNTKKRDEENMNLKEAIRTEVRNELKKLEITCQNMSSLLHMLGINVVGWPEPLPQQVQLAYKKALLTFHPDRAGQSDIRQQVEAEEKFKLINRMKEKFSPSHMVLK